MVKSLLQKEPIGATPLSEGAVHEHALKQPTFKVRPSLTAIAVSLSPYLILFTVILLIAQFFAEGLSNFGITFLKADLVHLSRIVRLIVLIEIIRRYLNNVYIFGKSRIEGHYGCLSFNYKASNIRYSDIREVTVHQTLIGRILGYGTLQLSTASTNGYEVELCDINAPGEFIGFINEIRSKSQKSEEDEDQYDE